MPIAITLRDMEILAEYLSLDIIEFFDTYCVVYPATSINTDTFTHSSTNTDDLGSEGALAAAFSYLSIGLPQPCPFLKENLCPVYDHRPMICRIFPLNVFASTLDHHELYDEPEYPCINQGSDLSDEQEEEYYSLFIERNEDHWETFQKVPSLEKGIRYDNAIIQSTQKLVAQLRNNGSEAEKQRIEREIIRVRIQFGEENARERVRNELITCYKGTGGD